MLEIDALKINLKQVPLQGLKLKEKVDPSKLEIDSDRFHFCKPVVVDMLVQMVTREILVKGSIRANYESECDRCLTNTGGETIIDNVLFDYEYHGQDFLDISKEVRDEILLSLPTKVLCDENCKGLCSRCHKNLNDGNCSCF